MKGMQLILHLLNEAKLLCVASVDLHSQSLYRMQVLRRTSRCFLQVPALGVISPHWRISLAR